MVGNKSEHLDRAKKIPPADYCSLCCCVRHLVIDHPRAHKLRSAGKIYESFKYLRSLPKNSDKGFPEDYLLDDGTTINPKYLLKDIKP